MTSNDVTYRDGTEITDTDIASMDNLQESGDYDKLAQMLAKFLREKKYGKTTRESLAQSVLRNFAIAKRSEDRAMQSSNKADSIEQRYNEQIAGSTNDNEVIDFRHSDAFSRTFTTAKKRADFIEDVLTDMRVNVQWFGADNTGQEDCWQALKDAVDFIKLYDLHVLYMPHGTYKITKNTQKIVLPDRVTVLGDRAEIKIDDDSSIPGKSSIFRGGEKFLKFQGIHAVSSLKEENNGTNPIQFYMNNNQNEEIQIVDCDMSYFRYVVMSSDACKRVFAVNNKFSYCVRDCIRMLNCLNAFCYNNEFSHCGDDVIALHYTSTIPYSYDNVSINIEYNTLIESQGIGLLGVDNAIVANNMFLHSINTTLKTGLPKTGSEGKRSKNIIFRDNIIDTPVHNDELTWRVGMQLNDQTYNFSMINNKFTNAHPVSTISMVNWEDGTIHEDVPVKVGDMTLMWQHGTGDSWDITRNQFTCGAGSYTTDGSIYSNNYIHLEAVTRLNINFNQFEDFIVRPIVFGSETTAKYAKVDDNYFDGDLNNRLHLPSKGAFTFNNQLNLVDKQPAELTRNEIRNVSSNGFSTGGNRVLTDFTGDKNIGVTYIFSLGDKIVPYSEKQGIINDIPDYVTELPTRGWFYKNTVLRYTGNNPKLLGWKRKTTGFGGDESSSWQRLEVA